MKDGMWPAANRPGARMFSQRLRGFGLWRPLQHPTHGRRIAGLREAESGYIVEKLSHPGRSLKVDGDGGLLQDGEGWTPQKTPPISTQSHHDLLPAASFGGAKVPQPLRELVSRAPG
jgi:hypothetical protein